MRLFVAVEVPSERLRSVLRARGDAPCHITMRFLGEVSSDRAAAIGGAVESAARTTPAFRYVLQGAGAFPSPERPRVLWVGVTEGSDGFRLLASNLTDALRSTGVPPEPRAFTPHVTVHRVTGQADARSARDWLSAHGAESFGAGEVSELLLKESDLRRTGAVHRVIGAYPLRRRGEGSETPGSGPFGAPSATQRLHR